MPTQSVSTDTELIGPHGNLTIAMSYRLTDGVAADLLLRGCSAIDLRTFTIGDREPLMAIDATAGVWHDLELVYVNAADSTEEQPAVLSELYIDGNLIHYQRALPYCKDGGPTSIRVSNGSVDLRDIRAAPVAGTPSTLTPSGEVALNVPLLNYAVYELPAQTQEFDDWEREPTQSGYIHRLHLNAIDPGTPAYAAAFTGTLAIPAAGDYEFRIWSPSNTKLYLDGRSVLDYLGGNKGRQKQTVTLEEGDHDFRLEHVFPGGWNQLHLAYTYGDQEERYINTMENKKTIAQPGVNEPLKIEPDDRPYILRSFAYFPTPKIYSEATKRTHVVSVGEGAGPHYSVDLQTGALLQAWRGEFADVQDMWIDRGEPQVMRPLGPAISFDGRPQWSDNPTRAWPEPPAAPDEDDFQHRAYDLDAAGRPTFEYQLAGATVTDYLAPDGAGLLRELTYTGGGGAHYAIVAGGKEITETSPGNYQLRSPGLNLSIESYDGEGLYLQSGGDAQRLIAHMGPGNRLRYRMDW